MTKILEKDTEMLTRFFGFRSKKEFVKDAVEEKVNRLKALLFHQAAEKVRKGLAKSGLTEEDILQDFERFRHL